ncbi:phosphoglucosamine mutase [Limibaculum sp. M0105]|uniref:Phosphoglucosamine mutase n=1 Tax=Thermohalobaculum xanthum TaxID=2753746 RepID=A0A8J7M8W8_9RHOB|nr:phosphoglucosamine mutase [Thermohalobaculum xanthum]MBK0400027.1 phosphoglucosamine mutase [Thermohalobaculum xanthum]
MNRKLFGTDGIRGRANTDPMTAEVAMRLGMAAGRHFSSGTRRHTVVIGKDTRRSGYMLEYALASGFVSVGMDVQMLGPIPTPAVGMLTQSLRADVGVMISASHNPFEDNGIKLFGPDGYKLSDEIEAEIERLMEAPVELAPPRKIGVMERLDDGHARYIEFAKATFPRRRGLDGLKVVIDCANGAAYSVAPRVLWELGAEIIKIGVTPNGENINRECGSTDPSACQRAVVESGADIGIALDGDADRVHLIDEQGRVIDGDQIMALIATRWAESGRLEKGTLVTTVMSNLGLERLLAKRGIALLRTKVGDRYVVEAMRSGGYNLGGEQSGHIVLADHVTTGDGLLAALQVLDAVVTEGRPTSEVCAMFEPFPQLLKNVRFDAASKPLADPAVRAAISDGEAALGASGRLVIRASGTEPVIRVMGEAEDAGRLAQVVDSICSAVERAAG